uniref:Sodium/calcium exchanger membrane region domain-containing protein n=1 Tax=Branchiostoma floridae TaxID=7739 RepID=C3YA82_BRAFL|eukprot:XP_002606620.1 hypothetical protein BRAFLDRAFT_209452 [Branchiostoma floridae]
MFVLLSQVIYMFAALAIVCDDYFVPSLEKISEVSVDFLSQTCNSQCKFCCRKPATVHIYLTANNLGLSDDVAGATFMAAGSSAPELFTSIIGVFIAKGDVGLGTIVGSAVFNILFVIGLCGLFAGIIVPLTWWPLFRDTAAYLVSIITLIFVSSTYLPSSLTSWSYESLVMLLEYTAYIFFMGFNPQVVGWLQRRKMRKQGNAVQHTEDANKRNSILMSESKYHKTPSPTHKPLMVDEIIQQSPRKLNFHDAGFRVMMTHHFKPETRLRAAARVLVLEVSLHDKQYTINNKHPTRAPIWKCDPDSRGSGRSDVRRNFFGKFVYSVPGTDSARQPADSRGSGRSDVRRDLFGKFVCMFVCLFNDLSGKFRWVVMLPCAVVLFVTCPDVRKRRWEKWFIVTFLMSIFWIFIFSYIMVFMATIIAYTLGIPDTITGITLLAAGTSVPDAMASLIVARQGLGDMAVSNSIGSNVFDILLGLGLPWFLKTTVVSWGGSVAINSRGMIYSVGLLFGTVVLMILGIHCNRWRLTRPLGIIAMITYAVFLVFAVCIECNVFVYVNPPLCPE